MGKIAVMTDSNSSLLPAEAEKKGIFMMNMPFFVNGKEYFEYEDMSYSDFFKVLASGADVSTSQPPIGMIIEKWDEILNEYDSIIYFPMSSELSGSYNTTKAIAEEYGGRIFVVESKRISFTLYEAALDALEMAKRGMSAEEIANAIENETDCQSIYLSVNTLEHLKKSGRVTSAGAAIGTLLGIKPVLQIQDGKLDAFKKVRGMNAAMDTMLDGIETDLNSRFKDCNVDLSVAYSGDSKKGKEWQKLVKKRFPDFNVGIYKLPISISCHVGEGALGIGITKLLR